MAMTDTNKMPTPNKPTPQARTTAKPAAAINHPAVNEYVTEWNRMAHEIDALKTENHQLRYDLDCARHMIGELQHISDHERIEKEKYQRWAVRFDQVCGEIATLSGQLRDEAREAAAPSEPVAQIAQQPEPEPSPPPPLDDIEAEVAEMARKFAPKPYP